LLDNVECTSCCRSTPVFMAFILKIHHLTATESMVSLYGRTWIMGYLFGQMKVWCCPTINSSTTALESLVVFLVLLHYHTKAKITLLQSLTQLLLVRVEISIVHLTKLFRTTRHSILPEDHLDHRTVFQFIRMIIIS